ncbi:TonB-dependent receptor [Rhodohalobacter halophilus]|uniref:TonB-dependent receptor n=1 Tax=Rhodohalobacter halophilus TaxID=1812810 RepID=UPI00083F94BF|nr:TonB-dependent receptor [Rhodohalobacter halophilus]
MKILSVQTLFTTLFLYLIFPQCTQAQAVADTLTLEEITVQSTRFNAERKHQPISVTRFTAKDLEIYGTGSIAELIGKRSSAVVREYSPGGLSNLSLRGYSPGRTQVVWNNFNLNDPVNGVFDLSLMPANFIRSMELSAGNSSTAYGSSAAGGTLYLDSGAAASSYSGWQTLGSYGQNLQGVNLTHRSGSWHAGLSLQREASDNDFEFENNGETQSRDNNRVEAFNALVNAGYETEPLSMKTTLWFYDVENQSPGSLSFPSETAVQDDRALRSATNIEYRFDNNRLYSNIIYSDADTDYTDEAFGTESETNIKSFSNEIGWSRNWLDNLKTDQSAQFLVNRVESTNFEQNESQFNFAYRLNSEWQSGESLRLFGGIRYDFYETAGDAVSGSFGANYNLFEDALILRGQWSRNFVAPTLNDLYWPDAGNPDLEPETNHKAEAGILSIHDYDGGRFEAEINGFAGVQKDGILWVFDQNGLSVRNVNEIETKGIELNLRNDFRLSSNLSLTIEGGSTYTDATITEDESNPEAEGGQLVYVPEWSHRAHLNVSWKNLSAGTDVRYTGERYTTQDNTLAEPLSSFTETDLFGRVEIPIDRYRFSITARVRNLGDSQNQFIDGYPLPGRSYLITARIGFNP